MLDGMKLDFYVPFPTYAGGLPRGGAGTAGDNVLYSTRAFVDLTSGRPRGIGALQSGEIACKYLSGSYTADQNSTLKWQQWDRTSGAWVTLNNNGAGDAGLANNPMNFVLEKTGGGDWQLVVNFAVAPGSFKHPVKIRLSETP